MNDEVCPICNADLRQRAEGECCNKCLATEYEMKEYLGENTDRRGFIFIG